MNTATKDQLTPLFNGAAWATFVWHSHSGGLHIATDKGAIRVPGGKRGSGDDAFATFGTYDDGDFPRTPEEVAFDKEVFDEIQRKVADPMFTRAVFNIARFTYFTRRA